MFYITQLYPPPKNCFPKKCYSTPFVFFIFPFFPFSSFFSFFLFPPIFHRFPVIISPISPMNFVELFSQQKTRHRKKRKKSSAHSFAQPKMYENQKHNFLVKQKHQRKKSEGNFL